MKQITNVLPFLASHDDKAITTFKSIDDAKLLANLIDHIPTPDNKSRYTTKLKVIHQAIMLFGNIANDDFLPSKASKVLIAKKVGCEMQHVRYFLSNRSQKKILEWLTVRAGGYHIRVDTTVSYVSKKRWG